MKIKAVLTTLLLVVLGSINCFAQLENPCGGNGDPDDPTTCPLDTWVVALVIVTLIFATSKLYYKQKSEQAIS